MFCSADNEKQKKIEQKTKGKRKNKRLPFFAILA
jgi:hypothetical protein